MSLPHPIPYQGSKRQLAASILSVLPNRVERLVEPFAGSGAVSIAAAAAQRAQTFWLNDINAPLMMLWRHLLEKPEALSRYYARLWQLQIGQERAFYDRVRSRFNRSARPAFLLYLLARCVKASVRYNAQGEFNQSPDNRRRGRRPEAMRSDILATAALLGGRTTLSALDYRDVLAAVNPTDVVYMDPPYQGVVNGKDNRYVAGVAFEAFVASLEELNTADIPFILSYDGKTGARRFGNPLPSALNLTAIEIDAGRSSQSTLLGRQERTYEMLYLSPALRTRLAHACVVEDVCEEGV